MNIIVVRRAAEERGIAELSDSIAACFPTDPAEAIVIKPSEVSQLHQEKEYERLAEYYRDSALKSANGFGSEELFSAYLRKSILYKLHALAESNGLEPLRIECASIRDLRKYLVMLKPKLPQDAITHSSVENLLKLAAYSADVYGVLNAATCSQS